MNPRCAAPVQTKQECVTKDTKELKIQLKFASYKHKHVCMKFGCWRGTIEGVSHILVQRAAGITAPTVLLQLHLRGPLLMHSFQNEVVLPVATQRPPSQSATRGKL